MSELSAPLSLFNRLGGSHAISAGVDRAFEFMAADPVVMEQFEGTDLTTQRRHVASMIIEATGGPRNENRPSIEAAHAGRGITGEQHTRVTFYIGAALGSLGVEQPELGEVVTLTESLRPVVVEQA